MNINENLAWQNFCKTGKVEDYIKYTQIKSQRNILGDMIQEATGAIENGGPDNRGADNRGERPFGNGANS